MRLKGTSGTGEYKLNIQPETKITFLPGEKPSDELAKATLDEVQLQFYLKNLVGKVLTIVDASVTDATQRQAMKDLMVDRMWETHWKLIGWVKDNSDPKNGSSFPF